MENYQNVLLLGSGACGSVYLARHSQSQKLYALKKIEINETKKNRTRENVLKEASILSKLKHPFIVSYHESFFTADGNMICIVQDYCDGGTLDDKINLTKKNKQYLSEKEVLRWFIQLALAVDYIHSQKVLHRDLKPQNIFLSKSSHMCKIGDFGISRVMSNTMDVAKTFIGTPLYLAPEMCQDIPYTSKADVWALGCLLYEMCALEPPFSAHNIVSLALRIIESKHKPIPNSFSDQLSHVIDVILDKNPEQRPSARQLLLLPVVKGFLESFAEEESRYLLQKQLKSQTDTKQKESQIFSQTFSRGASAPCYRRPANASPMNTAYLTTKRNFVAPLVRYETSIDGKFSSNATLVREKTDGHLLSHVQLENVKNNSDSEAVYSDDFEDEDDSSDDKSFDDVSCKEKGASDILDGKKSPSGLEDAPGLDYEDDFEEYNENDEENVRQAINQVNQLKDVCDIEDDVTIVDEMPNVCHNVIQKQYKALIGNKRFGELSEKARSGQLVKEEFFQLRHLIGAEDVETCNLLCELLTVSPRQ